jgi:hypothetical protein
MSKFDYDSFPDRLRAGVPGFDHVYDEHVADYDGVLPHVLLGDLVRFLSNEVTVRGAQSTALRAAMALLERGMESPDARLQELVAVSFLENLDSTAASFPVIRGLFGPRLDQQYKQYEET